MYANTPGGQCQCDAATPTVDSEVALSKNRVETGGDIIPLSMKLRYGAQACQLVPIDLQCRWNGCKLVALQLLGKVYHPNRYFIMPLQFGKLGKRGKLKKGSIVHQTLLQLPTFLPLLCVICLTFSSF